MPVTVEELHDELELAALQVCDGAPPGPLQAQRVRRAIDDVLRRHGLRARVEVLGGGQAARVHLMPKGPRVQAVVITVHTT
jgi:hypothetical protein